MDIFPFFISYIIHFFVSMVPAVMGILAGYFIFSGLWFYIIRLFSKLAVEVLKQLSYFDSFLLTHSCYLLAFFFFLEMAFRGEGAGPHLPVSELRGAAGTWSRHSAQSATCWAQSWVGTLSGESPAAHGEMDWNTQANGDTVSSLPCRKDTNRKSAHRYMWLERFVSTTTKHFNLCFL